MKGISQCLLALIITDIRSKGTMEYEAIIHEPQWSTVPFPDIQTVQSPNNRHLAPHLQPGGWQNHRWQNHSASPRTHGRSAGREVTLKALVCQILPLFIKGKHIHCGHAAWKALWNVTTIEEETDHDLCPRPWFCGLALCYESRWLYSPSIPGYEVRETVSYLPPVSLPCIPLDWYLAL